MCVRACACVHLCEWSEVSVPSYIQHVCVRVGAREGVRACVSAKLISFMAFAHNTNTTKM